MLFNTYRAAKGILQQGRISPFVINLNHPLFIFKITEPNGAITTVSYNHKGWMCDYRESEEEYSVRTYKHRKHNLPIPDRIYHPMFYRKYECSHIRASRLYLEKVGILLQDSPPVEGGHNHPDSHLQNAKVGGAPGDTAMSPGIIIQGGAE